MKDSFADRHFMTFGGMTPLAKGQVYCFAHAGGTAATFAPWARTIAARPDPALHITAIELPGHGTRMQEDLVSDVGTLADGIAQAIAGRILTVSSLPYFFYGHSLGGVIAFETVRRLEKLGVPSPRALIVGACRSPEMPALKPSISLLEKTDFIDAVQRRYGGIPAAVLEEPELLEMVLPILRADFRAYETYRYEPGPRISCLLQAFSGQSDPVVGRADMAGWSSHTSGLFLSHSVPGDHFFLTESRQLVLDALSAAVCLPGSRNGSFAATCSGQAGEVRP